jgi:hypothetical protein
MFEADGKHQPCRLDDVANGSDEEPTVANASGSRRRDAGPRASDDDAALPRAEHDDLLRSTVGSGRRSFHLSEHFHY